MAYLLGTRRLHVVRDQEHWLTTVQLIGQNVLAMNVLSLDKVRLLVYYNSDTVQANNL